MELLIVFAILGLIGVIVAAASLTFVGAAASGDENRGHSTADVLEASNSVHHWSASGYDASESL